MTDGKEADRRRDKPEEGKEGKNRKKATEREKEGKRGKETQKQEAGVGAARGVNGQQCLPPKLPEMN